MRCLVGLDWGADIASLKYIRICSANSIKAGLWEWSVWICSKNCLEDYVLELGLIVRKSSKNITCVCPTSRSRRKAAVFTKETVQSQLLDTFERAWR